MQDKLKHAFKETPERFRYAVDSAITEAQQSAPAKRRLSKGWKAAIAVVLILTLIPTAVFGASKIISNINAEKYKNYGVKITATVDPEADFPEYVKMNIRTPEGFAKVPNTDGLKFYNLSTEQPYTDGFSVDPFRTGENGVADIADRAESYKETVIAGHTAYKIISAENNTGWDRVYVYFENVNVMVLVYSKDVTEQQLTDFIAGITFTEGTAGDHTEIGSYDFSSPEDPSDSKIDFPDSTYIEKPLDTEIIFGEYSEDYAEVTHPSVSARVTGVQIKDSVSGLDRKDINDTFPLNQLTDSKGTSCPAPASCGTTATASTPPTDY